MPQSDPPNFDLLFKGCRLPNSDALVDLGVKEGKIAAVAPALEGRAKQVEHLGGRLVVNGFVDTHIHLDKACLLCRCRDVSGGLKGAIATVSALKKDFTTDDVYSRGARVIERAILEGTMHMRAHVEVDPRAGLRSFEAMKQLKRDYAFALNLQICVFPQEGLTNDEGAEALLRQALMDGADLLGGCPYTDTDPAEQIRRLFTLACEFDVDLDFHLDFDLDPSWSHLERVCEATEKAGWQGRVAIGHVTKLAVMSDERFQQAVRRLAEADVAVTALPSTDLYLNGRDKGLLAARGVAPVHLLRKHKVRASVATNNVLNPFTPFGDASLLRMANLYANVMQLGPDQFSDCLALVCDDAAEVMGVENYGLSVGRAADLVVLDDVNFVYAFGGIARPIMGFKAGMKTFERPAGRLLR